MTDGTQFETRLTWGAEGDILKLEIDQNLILGLVVNKSLWIKAELANSIKNFKILNLKE